ncbi:hypothetical protein WN48_09565 [Eufriesea mexicana]|nr:hypothetical protein WN48_09565 [Eufriesea mexicana]
MRGKGGDRGRRAERRGGGGGEWGGEDRSKKRSMKEEGYAGHAMVLTCAKCLVSKSRFCQSGQPISNLLNSKGVGQAKRAQGKVEQSSDELTGENEEVRTILTLLYTPCIKFEPFNFMLYMYQFPAKYDCPISLLFSLKIQFFQDLASVLSIHIHELQTSIHYWHPWTPNFQRFHEGKPRENSPRTSKRGNCEKGGEREREKKPVAVRKAIVGEDSVDGRSGRRGQWPLLETSRGPGSPCPWQDITRQSQQEKRSPMALEGRPTGAAAVLASSPLLPQVVNHCGEELLSDSQAGVQFGLIGEQERNFTPSVEA